MSSSLTLALTALFLAVPIYVLLGIFQRRRIRALMPPGPPGVPFLGNALQMQKDKIFLQFAELGKTYGPIISLDMAGKHVVVVNSLNVANDLFSRRSAIYSDRPRLIMAFELLTGRRNLALMPYGHDWRKQRRAVHEAMNIRDVSAYNPLQEQAAVNLVLQLLDSPGDWKRHSDRAIASSVTSIVYGTSLTNRSLDDILDRIFEVVHAVSDAAGKGRHLVEFFPSMLLLPDWLAAWKRNATASFRKYTALFEEFYEDARINMHKVGDNLSFCSHLMKNEERFGLGTQEAAWLAAVLILAGVDTSSGMFSAFFVCMLRNPDIMRRAQEEVDVAVGRSRLPTLDDLNDLPYTYAVVHELLRWWPVAPLSLPRCTTEDDWYNGYFIPKGTTVLQNLWAMGRNPEDFPDPESFRPERYLDKDSDGSLSIKPSTQKPFAFGFGRRICPGSNVAMRNIFIDIACILWAFDIYPSVDEKGEPIIPSGTDCFDDGLVITPLAFPCVIRPRSHDIEQIVKSTLQAESQ